MQTAIPRVIIDTDIFSDVDDVGALAVAHHHQSAGLARIEAVTVNTPSVYGVTAARAVNEFFGRPEIPIGRFAATDESLADREYARLISPLASRSTDDGEAVAVLRRVLAAADDASITIITLGFMDNLAGLVASEADEFSPLRGRDLVARKVAATVLMAGKFPSGREFNLVGNPQATGRFLAQWPTPMTFLGWEVGSDVVSGSRLDDREVPPNPVAIAYTAWCGRGVGRSSWDLQTVDLAIRGELAPYRLSEPGEMLFDVETGENGWVSRADGPHRHVIRTEAPDVIARELDVFLGGRAPEAA
ncbi:MAG TPA: nucleoside hydrolase [Actinospica sp.]|jgi:hypothetical protein|nr:nucleoside hydrolase [Actinospica sp.]